MGECLSIVICFYKPPVKLAIAISPSKAKGEATSKNIIQNGWMVFKSVPMQILILSSIVVPMKNATLIDN